MKTQVTNILMVGVGGQGVILASEIVSDVVMRAGYDVKKSEVHGMAQRGGSVNSHVRFGPQVYSPIITPGQAHILFSFEQLETLRYLEYLAPEAIVLMNSQRIAPPSVLSGSDGYPEDIPADLAQRFAGFRMVDALAIARQAGTDKAVNVAFCGALSNYLAIDPVLWHAAIRELVPPKAIEVNLQAFDLGRQAGAGEGGA